MKIAILGWGSLVWDPDGLAFDDNWRLDGPRLPVEFARISNGGRLTLVLLKGVDPVTTLWTVSSCNQLTDAIENLKQREGTQTADKIGFVSVSSQEKRCEVVPSVAAVIDEWTRRHHFDATIWTDLSSNFKDKTGKAFNSNNVLAYLRELKDAASKNSREYIMKAPPQIRTQIRGCIEESLGWKST